MIFTIIFVFLGLELLQKILIQAVLNGHCGAVRKGGEELNEYFSSKTKTTGPQALDYLPPEEGKVKEGVGSQLTDAWLLRRCRTIIITSL